jgi:uncharacterized protein (TIGR03067 family)
MWFRVLPLLFIAAPVWAEAKKTEPKVDPALKGKWEIVSGKFNGNESATVKGRILKFTSNELVTYFSDDDKDLTVSVTFDLSKTPKQFDIDHRFGDVALAIYTIEKDTLKICYAEPGADRPTKFESPAGERVFLLVLKRKE